MSQDSDLSDEANVQINGQWLRYAEAMTLRVAVTQFIVSLQSEDSLGVDRTGREIRADYLRHLARIEQLLLSEKP